MAGKQTVEHLKKISLFSSCSTKDLQKIAKASDELSVSAGTILVDGKDIGTFKLDSYRDRKSVV